MGLFDGAGALDERGSTAHLAKILAAPVVLVVNGKAMARAPPPWWRDSPDSTGKCP